MGQVRPTNANQPFASPASGFGGQQSGGFGGQTPPPTWGTASPHAIAPPAKNSKTWLWVLGIIGGLVLLCGGGLAALVAFVPDSNSKSNNNNNYNSGVNNTNRTNTASNNSNSNANSKVQKDDFSGWPTGDQTYGVLKYEGGEYFFNSDKPNFFSIIHSTKVYRTENATTKLTVRNPTAGATDSGYGLVIHGDPDAVLKQDYAFLIDSKLQKYRIVRHKDKKETTVTSWTFSSAIKSGTDKNVLEIKDDDGTMTFYINGSTVTSLTDSYGIKSGISGIYVSDTFPIAFSNLEIRK
jgi:hypothetical protein